MKKPQDQERNAMDFKLARTGSGRPGGQPAGPRRQLGLLLAILAIFLGLWPRASQAMPAQVILIRHAEKYEDRAKINLTPRGLTRALALSEFFRADPRVVEFGPPAAIIAQAPTEKKKSVRPLETVEPLSQALGLTVIYQFTYGQADVTVNWLKDQRQYDGKNVLICAQHMEIDDFARALGVTDLRPRTWPHETYDRFYLLKFSPADGKLLSFSNLPMHLLFGDSFQAAAPQGLTRPDKVSFSQTYLEKRTQTREGREILAPVWRFSFSGVIHGDFSNFDDATIPILRIGGFTFGYYLTTLGHLKKDKNAVLKVNEAQGSGTLTYHYRAALKGRSPSYAQVYFDWNKRRLKIKFQAAVDEREITPELDAPVEVGNEKPLGLIVGAAPCYIGFGPKRFHAPAGLIYLGSGGTARTGPHKGSYQATLGAVNGILLAKPGPPEP
jgi:hypothetical protein